MEEVILRDKGGNNVPITDREKDILLCLMTGKRTKGIAENLKLSPRTVDNMILNLRLKIDANSRDELRQNCLLNKKTSRLQPALRKNPLKKILGVSLVLISGILIIFYTFYYKNIPLNSFEWNLPLKNIYYTPRMVNLDNLQSKLNHNSKGNIVTIYGLAGVGKTTFAKHYAHDTKKKYAFKVWLNAETPAILEQEILQLGEYKSLFDVTDSKGLKIIKVIRWFEEKKNGLVIFDNAEDFDSIKNYVPKYSDIIITSLNNRMPATIYMDTMTAQEASELFTKIHITDEKNKEIITSIVNKLGYLPLAIVQAASYVKENNISLEYFENAYTENLEFLLKQIPYLVHDHLPAYVTWKMNLSKITSVNSIQILKIISFLLPEKIDKKLISFLVLGSANKSDILKIESHLSELRKFSLIHIEKQHVSIHRLFHKWLQKSISEDREEIINLVLLRLSKLYNSELVNIKNVDFIRILIPHTERILELVREYPAMHSENLYEIYLGLVKAFDLIGDYKNRKKYLQLAYVAALEFYGESSIELGKVFYAMGRYEIRVENFIGAETNLKKALSIFEAKYLTHNQEKLLCLNELGRVSGRLSNYKDAIEYQKSALGIAEKIYDSDHIEIANILNEYGWVLFNYGDYHNAKKYLLRSVHIHEKKLGNEHVETARVLKSLGCVLVALREFDEAKKTLDRSHKIRKEHYGENHIKVLNVLAAKAILSSVIGDNKEAIAILEKCKKITEKLHEKNIIFKAALDINLGNIYLQIGYDEIAGVLLKTGLDLFEQNPSTNLVNLNVARYLLMIFEKKNFNQKSLENMIKNKLHSEHNYIKYMNGLNGDLFILNT